MAQQPPETPEEEMDVEERIRRGPVFMPPRKSSSLRGEYTGARRAPYPPVFRRCGNMSTRECVVGKRPTGMHHYGYDKGIVGSKPVASLIPASAPTSGQGCPSVLSHVPQLRSGPRHWLFEG
jgi:hypothetical protein